MSATSYSAKSFDQVCKAIDWPLLKKQKLELIKLQEETLDYPEWLEGLLSLLDALQDSAVDYYGVSEDDVFVLGIEDLDMTRKPIN